MKKDKKKVIDLRRYIEPELPRQEPDEAPDLPPEITNGEGFYNSGYKDTGDLL